MWMAVPRRRRLRADYLWTATEVISKRLEISLIALLVLALTLPFIGQAIHIDAHLYLDWAEQAYTEPWWQHLPDYDYFGVHYDEFHDTHPRLQSLYLNLVWRLAGEASEPALHLAMMPFTVLAAVSMYFLARRFGVNALLATMMMVVAPAFLVNSHLIMTDVPGISFWLTGLVFFIHGVDRGRWWALVLAGLFFTLTIFTYYQGLSALPLAFLYLFIHRRIRPATVLPLAVPALLFGAYVAAHLARYGQPPTFSYPFGLPLDPLSVLRRIRGVTVLIGGAVLFPVSAIAIFLRPRYATWAVGATMAVAAVWAAFLYLRGSFLVDAIFLLPLLLAAGVAVLWVFTGSLFRTLVSSLKGRSGQDRFFLSVWFFGTAFYCAILLPYPSPRYLIPLIPPMVIVAMKMIEKRWHGGGLATRVIALIILPTLAVSLMVAVAEHQRADNNRAEADWVAANLSGEQGQVWFNGGLGFQYYLEQKGMGYRMVTGDGEEIKAGDVIVESVHNNRWPFSDSLLDRVEFDREIDFPRSWPVTSEYYRYRTSWLGQIGMVLPYGVSGDYLDRLYIYRVRADYSPDSGEDAGREEGRND